MPVAAMLRPLVLETYVRYLGIYRDSEAVPIKEQCHCKARLSDKVGCDS